jgi:hypothetical protein
MQKASRRRADARPGPSMPAAVARRGPSMPAAGAHRGPSMPVADACRGASMPAADASRGPSMPAAAHRQRRLRFRLRRHSHQCANQLRPAPAPFDAAWNWCALSRLREAAPSDVAHPKCMVSFSASTGARACFVENIRYPRSVLDQSASNTEYTTLFT